MPKSNVTKKPTISWSEQSRKLREEFSELTDRDLYFEQGRMEEMIKRVQSKVGVTKHELYQLITKH
jgi:uncharacterized protein YjbJ (UPF0337 family)